MNFETVKRWVLDIVQPLSRGNVVKTIKDKVKLTDLFPQGTRDDFTNGSLYGIASYVPKKVKAFYLNMLGDQGAPVIIAHIDAVKPEVTKDGQIIFYCRKPNGVTFPVKMNFDPDGDLIIDVERKVIVNSKEVTINSNKVVANCANAEINSSIDTKVTTPKIIATSNTSMELICEDIKVGKTTFEKIVNGETFLNLYNPHFHIDGLGLPTSNPTVQMVEATHLSSQVKAGK